MESRKISYRSKKGFTLLELIIVIAILGILASVAVPQLNSLKEDSKGKADVANAKIIFSTVSILSAIDELPSDISVPTSNDYISGVIDGNITSEYGDVVESYLQSIPIPKAQQGRFIVVIESGKVSIYVTSVTGGNLDIASLSQIYPKP